MDKSFWMSTSQKDVLLGMALVLTFTSMIHTSNVACSFLVTADTSTAASFSRIRQPTTAFLYTSRISSSFQANQRRRSAGTSLVCRDSHVKNRTDAIQEILSQEQFESWDAVCEKKLDYVGAGTLGDIMSEDELGEELTPIIDATDTSSNSVEYNSTVSKGICKDTNRPTKSGLVTSTGGTLERQFGSKISNLTPLDRIALTANGNLQRIVSSFYDAPVHIHVDRCERRNEFDTDSDAVWDRTVHLSVYGQNFCVATSAITVYSDECVRIIESGEIGIGQLFRHLDKLPTFTILDAGRNREGGLWRKYELRCCELTCTIREDFSPNVWNFFPQGLERLDEFDNTF